MNLDRNSKITRQPWAAGPRRGDWQGGGTSPRPRVGGTRQVETTRAPIQAAADGGAATASVRARPRALRYDFLPCRRQIQTTATNGRPITLSETSEAAATLARCCGRARPRSDCARPAHFEVQRQVAAFSAQAPRSQAPRKLGDTPPSFRNSAPNRPLSPSASAESQTRKNKVNQDQSRSIKVKQGHNFFNNVPRSPFLALIGPKRRENSACPGYPIPRTLSV